MNSRFWVCLCVFAGWLSFTLPAQMVMPLNQGWILSNPQTHQKWPAKVPGTVQQTLVEAGKIPHPFFGLNADALRKLETQNWTYQCEFSIPDSIRNCHKILLSFSGLDTYASVYLNGVFLFGADNQFRSWEFDIKPHLKKGPQKLEVCFASTYRNGEKLGAKSGLNFPADSDDAPEKVSVFVRKAPFQFGWDWSPRILTTGIWRPVRLSGISGPELEDWQMKHLICTRDLLKTIFTFQINLNQPGTWQLVYQVGNQEKRLSFSGKKGRHFTLKDTFLMEKPALWWPRGYGKSNLYDFQIKLMREDGVSYSFDKERIGFREIKLIQEEDSLGRSFYFQCNGQPVFAMGANYVPNSAFLVDNETLQPVDLVERAAMGNMNMLRVWGGGIYESEAFYSACDSLGIMVWQDFTFACSMYPGSADFQENVSCEIREQVSRLEKHPCLALWCGNNEIDVAWHNWGWQQTYALSETAQSEMWTSYTSLFDTLIPSILREKSSSVDYLPSSPVSNWGKPEEFTRGDNHYWGIWHGEAPIADFETHIPRFMSEYGFPAYPEKATLGKWMRPSDLVWGSEAMEARQRSYKGNGLLLSYLRDNYPDPGTLEGRLYLGQLLQADAFETAIRAHRIAAPRCMGTLLWQLNDAWPGVSWSLIDYEGRKKAAWDRVSAFYAPVRVMVWDAGESWEYWLVNSGSGIENLDIVLRTFDFQGEEVRPPVLWKNQKVEAGEFSKRLAGSFIHSRGDAETFEQVIIRNSGSGEIVWQGVLERSAPAELKLSGQNPEILITPTEKGCSISLTAQTYTKAVFLHFENGKGQFSENYFDLLPGETKTLYWFGEYSGKPVLHHLGQYLN